MFSTLEDKGNEEECLRQGIEEDAKKQVDKVEGEEGKLEEERRKQEEQGREEVYWRAQRMIDLCGGSACAHWIY